MTGRLEICCDVLIGKKGGRGRSGKRRREKRREERQSGNCKVLITFHIETMCIYGFAVMLHLFDVFMIKILKT